MKAVAWPLNSSLSMSRHQVARDANQRLLVLDQAQAQLLLGDFGIAFDGFGLTLDFFVAQIPEGRNDGRQEEQHRQQGPERGEAILA